MTGAAGESLERLEDILIHTHCNARLVPPSRGAAPLSGEGAGDAAAPAETTSSGLALAVAAASAARPAGARAGAVARGQGTGRAMGDRSTAAQRDRRAGLQDVLHPISARRETMRVQTGLKAGGLIWND